MKGLIRYLLTALTVLYIGCSTVSAQSLTPDEIRTILKLESSYRACLEENDILTAKESAYLTRIELKDGLIKNQTEILKNKAEVELNLRETILNNRKTIASQQRQIKLFKTGMFLAVGIIPLSLVVGTIYTPF